ncbi:MAG: hypothetical protein WCX17_01115 [Parcubacteria group bacterium]|jgi:hypothetical protein
MSASKIKSIEAVGIDLLALKTATGFCKEITLRIGNKGEAVASDLIHAIWKEKMDAVNVGILLRLLGAGYSHKLVEKTKKFVEKNGAYMMPEQLEIAKRLCTGAYII